MKTLVMKFGGTSTGNVVALNRAADIVVVQQGQWDRLVVVVSAMEGVTDMLIECAERSLAEDKGHYQVIIDELRIKLKSVVWAVFAGDQSYEQLNVLIVKRIQELTEICQRIQLQGRSNPRDMDEIAAMGERINVHIFSALLNQRGVHSQAIDSANLIVTDDCYQAASPIESATDALINAILSPLFAKFIIPVVTGFIGATPNGTTTTLGRGGSDYTAAILGKSLKADEVWIWTDVDGIMTADPGLTPRARLIPDISYNEVYQLAYSGAKVMHPKTILLAREGDIPLWVKNTFNSECKGTRISHCSLSDRYTISAVTGLFDINLITFRTIPGGDVNKIKALILAALKNRGTTTLAVFQAKHDRSVSFAFSANNSNHVIQTIREDGALRSLGWNFSQPQVVENVALITLVGREIYLTPQVLSLATSTLNKAGIDIKRIGNGTSPDSLVFAVANKDGEHAIKQIHDEVILNGALISPIIQPVMNHLSAT
jgi:aspartate kinase